jgi:predicted ester cyclase
MKKIISICFILIVSFNLASFAQSPAQFSAKDADPNNATKTTAMAVSKAILEADWEKLDALLDDKFTYTGDGMVFTKNEYIGFMQEMRSAFSNFNMSLEKSVQEGNFVSIRFVATANNTGKFMGAPATNKKLEVNGIFMRKVENGKVMQEWQTTDLLGCDEANRWRILILSTQFLLVVLTLNLRRQFANQMIFYILMVRSTTLIF